MKRKMSALDKLYNLVKTLNMNDDNMEKCCGVSTDFIRKLTDLFFIIIGEKASTNIPLGKMYLLRKSATLKFLYGPMYLQLDNYPPYDDKRSVIFETNIKRNLRCSHGYTNCVRHTDLITWVICQGKLSDNQDLFFSQYTAWSFLNSNKLFPFLKYYYLPGEEV